MAPMTLPDRGGLSVVGTEPTPAATAIMSSISSQPQHTAEQSSRRVKMQLQTQFMTAGVLEGSGKVGAGWGGSVKGKGGRVGGIGLVLARG